MGLNVKAGLKGLWGWVRARVIEPSTWAGAAMIAVAMGSDPMQAHGLAEAISLIVGGGLVARTGVAGDAGEAAAGDGGTDAGDVADGDGN